MPREGYIAHLRSFIGSDPLFMPSVTVLVRSDDRILVGRHRDLGLWVVPGGALEPGELPAEAAVREVWEETDLHVELTGLYGAYGGGDAHRVTYPNRDIVDYVALVFEAVPVGGRLAARTDELEKLGWVTESELRALDTPAWLTPMLDSPGFEPTSWMPPASAGSDDCG
jgi:8-oxo-dGTP pyrophosphatase MutT (NUDIX family)